MIHEAQGVGNEHAYRESARPGVTLISTARASRQREGRETLSTANSTSLLLARADRITPMDDQEAVDQAAIARWVASGAPL